MNVSTSCRGLLARPCVEYCAKKWPEISFAIEDIAAKDVLAKVKRGDVEFGVTGGYIDASELHVEDLTKDPFVLACRRDDELARSKVVAWGKLSGRRLVMLDHTSGSRPQIMDTLTKAGVKAQISLELAQPSSVLAMVEAKLGIAVVPMLVAPIESHPALTIRKLVRPSVNRTIFLLKRRDRSLSPAASAVWSALVQLFRRRQD
jgi:DNA-binding transcriptional LysR family regulator